MKFVAGCALALGLALSTHASAQLLLPAGGSAEQEDPAVDEGAVIVEEAPQEQQELRSAPPPPVEEPTSRSWLRQDTPSAKGTTSESGSSGTGLSALALLLVLGLAGGAAYMHFRRGNPKTVRAASSMRVLSSVRIGPKANLVTVLVSDRVMILGVTENNIVELGSLAGENDASQEDDESASPSRPVRAQAAASREPFERVLANSTGRAPFQGNPGVASLLAAQTEDVVHTRKTTSKKRGRAESPSEDSAAPRVEDQAAGLLRRRS